MTGSAARGFGAWAACAALSALGDAITFFALAWVASTHGAAVTSLVLTIGSVPLCLLVVAGGLAADRWGARAVMAGCDLAMAAVMAAFALGALWSAPVWALAALSLASGTASALRRPAAGLFPRLFARGDVLSRRMATVTLLLQLAQVSGPVVAGVLLALGGLSLTSAVDATTFVVVALVLVRLRPPLAPAPPRDGGGVLSSLREGARAARRSPGVPAAVVAVCGLAVTVLPLVDLCVPLAGHLHGWGAGGTGLVVASWPVGGMAVMAVVSRRGAPGRRASLAGTPVAAVGSALLALSPSVVAATLAVLLVGVGTSLTTARLIPRFVDATLEPLMARFQSLLQLAQIAPALLVTPLLGWAAHQ